MMSQIATLAAQQLDAYNASDLDAFCACYHVDVRVLDGEEETLRGMMAFRQRYQPMFEGWSFRAEVPQRLHLGPHCIDLETWWRTDPNTGEESTGQVMVRYHERDGLIGTVQFLR